MNGNNLLIKGYQELVLKTNNSIKVQVSCFISIVKSNCFMFHIGKKWQSINSLDSVKQYQFPIFLISYMTILFYPWAINQPFYFDITSQQTSSLHHCAYYISTNIQSTSLCIQLVMNFIANRYFMNYRKPEKDITLRASSKSTFLAPKGA